MFWLSSFGRSGLSCVAGLASARRCAVALAAARRRFPGGRVYRRSDGSWRYLAPFAEGSGLLCVLLVQPAQCGVGDAGAVCWFVGGPGEAFPVRRF